MTENMTNRDPSPWSTQESQLHREHGAQGGGTAGGDLPIDDDIIRPVNWNTLTAVEAEHEWLDLNAWVHWLRHSYGLPAAVVPPAWHRHNALVLELSALHIAWLAYYDPDGSPTGPLLWHEQFANARHRLRELVLMIGTKLDRDRPTRVTTWPGETPEPTAIETEISDRESDFYAFVAQDLEARRRIEERVAHRFGLHT